MSGNMSLERCFKEAEETGRLNLSLKNLRDFPDPAEDCELIDVIEIGPLEVLFLPCRVVIDFISFQQRGGFYILAVFLLSHRRSL